MSGIAGILHLDGKEAQARELEAMGAVLSHRGPDGVNFYRDGPAGLVSLCMRTEPEMPDPCFFSEDGLALDGRLDNPDTLSRLLKRKGAAFSHPLSAAEMIFNAYHHLNDIFPNGLLGDFSFALWDSKQNKFVLARDPVGVKPLFYFKDESRFIFASEAKAIFALEGVERKPNEKVLREFEEFRFRSIPETFFQGIYRLPPGNVMEAGGTNKISLKPYWKPDPFRKIRMKDRRSYAARFRKLFLEAVRCRLPQSGTCAVSLSGGQDSSSITCAAKFLKKPCRLIAVSQIFRNYPDERMFIRKVVEAAGCESFAVFTDDCHLLDNIEEAIYYQESPYYGAQYPPLLRLYKMTAEKGARVLLEGEWGDQLLTGAGYLADFLKQGRFLKFWNALKILPKYEMGTPKDILNRVFLNLLFNSVFNHLILKRRFGPLFPLCAQRELYEEMFHPHNIPTLEATDRMGAQAGVEVRFPFLDRRLFEFALAIPAEERVRDQHGKRLLRESMHGILIDAIAKRRDKGDSTDAIMDSLKEAGCVDPVRSKDSPASGALARRASNEVDTNLPSMEKLWRKHTIKLWSKTWIVESTKPFIKNEVKPKE